MNKKDKNSKPLVSICIPTYNGEKFIREALDSVVNQTYSNLEVIISDDASVDQTLKIVNSFKIQNNIPVYIFNHVPEGIGANWNHSIKKANGKYIKFLFQDDILKPGCVETLVTILENNLSAGLVACQRDFIIDESYSKDEASKWMDIYSDLQKTLSLNFEDGLLTLDNRIFKMDAFFNIPHNKIGEPTAVLFRKDILKEIGFFRKDLKQALDYEFYYRLLKKAKIIISKDVLVTFRLHSLQASAINKCSDIKDFKVFDKIIYNEYFNYLNADKKRELSKKYSMVSRAITKFKRKLKK